MHRRKDALARFAKTLCIDIHPNPTERLTEYRRDYPFARVLIRALTFLRLRRPIFVDMAV